MTHTSFITAVSALTSGNKKEPGWKGFVGIERFSCEISKGKSNLEQALTVTPRRQKP